MASEQEVPLRTAIISGSEEVRIGTNGCIPRDIITVVRSPCSIINTRPCRAIFMFVRNQGTVSRSYLWQLVD
jgi:hypothetical protein